MIKLADDRRQQRAPVPFPLPPEPSWQAPWPAAVEGTGALPARRAATGAGAGGGGVPGLEPVRLGQSGAAGRAPALVLRQPPAPRERCRRGCTGASPTTARRVPTSTVAPFGHEDLGEHAGCGRGHLGVDLVGRDLEERLVLGDSVADLLQPADDGALGDRLAELRHRDVSQRGGPFR